MGPIVLVSGAFDNVRSLAIRFFEESAKLGYVHVQLWSDDLCQRLEGRAPKFPASERRYLLQAIRYIASVQLINDLRSPHELAALKTEPGPLTWVVPPTDDSSEKSRYCSAHAIRYHVLRPEQLEGFPKPSTAMDPLPPGRKKVLVTGCYDWLHSGHVRFFEEVNRYGEVYAVLGHDANIRILKGEGHPLFPEQERRYVVGAVRFVREALIATGHGWLDAEPEIARLRPDIYAVNDDGDKGGKREFCEQHGIEYLVLQRTPAPGLPRRSSTDLRGF